MVSSLIVRSLLYNFMSNMISHPNIVQLSIWEELICVYDGSFAQFSYPCVRNSYVSFGVVQLSTCEELVCAFFNDDQHMFCIHQVTMSIVLASL